MKGISEPSRSLRTRRFLVAPMLAALVIAVLLPGGAQAMLSAPQGVAQMGIQSNGVFELDADLPPASPTNTDSTAAGLPDDWDRICHTATASLATPLCTSASNDHATARTFISEVKADGSANQATIFTGGGSKDPQPISQWGWKDNVGGLPDKDNLLHGMAARYSISPGSTGCPATATTSCELIYFAADRFDNSGDSQIGFWLFKSAVSTNANGSFTGSHTAGSVPHNPSATGDILVLSDFTQGGTQPTIRIFEWVGAGGSDGSVNLIAGTATVPRDCANAPASTAFCASVNPNDGQDPPWPFLNKSGQTTYGHGEFYEGGIDLSALGFGGACFSSFLAETRSSQSVTATLKDFVLGTFQICGATMVTTPSVTVTDPLTPVAPGTQVTDTAVVTGGGTVSPPFPSSPPNVVFSICGPISAADAQSTFKCDGSSPSRTASTFGTSKPLSATATQGVSQATSDAVTKNAPGVYCFKATWAGDANYPGGASDIGSNGSECFRVQDTSSVATAQEWRPNDSATITSGAGSALNGTLIFELHNAANCGGTVVYTEPTITLTNATSPATRSTTNGTIANTTFIVTSANNTGAYSWKVTFTSSDAGVASPSTATCENSTLTITN